MTSFFLGYDISFIAVRAMFSLVLFDVFKFSMTLWQDMTAAATAFSQRQYLWMHVACSYSDGKRLREPELDRFEKYSVNELGV